MNVFSACIFALTCVYEYLRDRLYQCLRERLKLKSFSVGIQVTLHHRLAIDPQQCLIRGNARHPVKKAGCMPCARKTRLRAKHCLTS